MRTGVGQGLLRQARTDLWQAAPYAIGYGASVLFGIVEIDTLGVAAIWTANAFLVLGLLMLERRPALWCLALCTIVTILPGLRPDPVEAGMATMGGLNLIESVLIAALTRQVCRRNPNFADVRPLITFVVGAVAPACLVSAVLVDVLVVVMRLPLPSPGVNWFLSHVLGTTIVVPAGMVLARRRRFRAISQPAIETAASLAVFLASTSALFWLHSQGAALFLVFPMMMLIAFRYGPVGAASASFLLGLVTTVVSYAWLDRLTLGSTSSAIGKVQWLQFFVATAFLTTLPAAGAVASYARLRSLLARRTCTARQARRRADSAAAAKSEFLANMSHEIRTPLNGVIGLADALSRSELTPQQREMLKMILDSGKALTSLLSDALDLARAESGALRLSEEPLDVRETIGSAAFLFEAVAREKGLSFRVVFDVAPPGAVMGDALRIKQVVSNFISNAVKFTAVGEVLVQVCLKPESDGRMRLSVSVRDTGPGFGAEVKARLFNRFEQGDSSVTRRHGGSGLGLSIVQRLGQLMQADIACESELDVGSVFTFSVALPPAEPGAAAEASAVATLPALPGRRMSVLLAEDHPVNRKVIQAMLGDLVELTMAENGEAAVQAVRATAFDAILMDTHMPVMDGLTAIRIIRSDEVFLGRARTPIVSLTADAMPQQLDAAFAAGADLHVAKPITGEALFSALKACLRRRDPNALAAAG